MRRSATTLAVATVTMFAVALPAMAECAKFGFSVNDYGKEGPTRDAQDLLDKSIAKWAAENKIKKYQVGKKETTCELFLNFIVFDEHTCKAEALVCVDGKMPGKPDLVTPPKGTALTTVNVPAEKTSPVQTGAVAKRAPAKKEPAKAADAPKAQ